MTTETKATYPTTMLERSLLALLMKDGSLLNTHAWHLQPYYFQQPEHGILFQAMLELYTSNAAVDQHTLLRVVLGLEMEYPWKQLIDEILLLEPGAHRLSHLVRMLEEQYRETKMNELAVTCTDTELPIEQRIRMGLDTLYELTQLQSNKQTTPLKEKVKEVIDIFGFNSSDKRISSGFPSLERAMGAGFERSQLVVVGARPGIGKTGFLCSLARNFLQQQVRVLFVSYHMNTNTFLHTMCGSMSSTSLQDLNDPKIFAAHRATLEQLAAADRDGMLKFHAIAGYPANDLLAVVASQQYNYGVDVVIIDSIQQSEPAASYPALSRNNSLGLTLRRLKHLAQERNMLVIVGSEIHRLPELRREGGHRPRLTDLKDSTHIEEVADVVMLLYRPEYYGFYEWEDGMPTKDILEVIVARNRMYGPAKVQMKYFSESRCLAELPEEDLWIEV